MTRALRHRQSGMTLVEIMVAVAIGLIGVIIIMQAYLTNEKFSRSTLGEGGAQTNGMVALYTMERDVRMGGYGLNTSGALGCGSIFWYFDPNYSSNISGGTLPNLTLAPVNITVSGTASTPDQVTVMFTSAGERILPTTISGFNASSSEVNVDGTSGFKAGDLVLLVNAAGCTLGKITQVQAGPQKLQLNPGISAPHNPPAWGSFPTSYSAGDSMLNLGNPVVRTYSIASTGKLQVADTLLQSGAVAPVAIVDGIIDLRAQYGKDTDADNIVDAWNNTAPTTGAQWLQVQAVRLGVLARIGNYEKPEGGGNCDATTATPSWTGGNFGAVDVTTTTSIDRCYRYRVFETTVPLRNMIWKP